MPVDYFMKLIIMELYTEITHIFDPNLTPKSYYDTERTEQLTVFIEAAPVPTFDPDAVFLPSADVPQDPAL